MFLAEFPECIAFFTGDTPQKTRVYNEVLRRNFAEFSMKYRIFGEYLEGATTETEAFKIDREYTGFYIYLLK